MRTPAKRKLAILVGLSPVMSLGSAVTAQAPAETDINDIVMYAIESSDPARLMRYFFASDTFVMIGEVWATDGRPVYDVEALSFVAQGPYKGLYGVATDGPTRQYLTRIDPLTATATVYGSNLGGAAITGMIADYDAALGEWWLLATDKGKKLRRINIADGNATTIANVGKEFEGLARNSDGVIYANTKTKLYRFDPRTGDDDDDEGFGGGITFDIVEIGSTGLGKAESLEFCFGNTSALVDVPGVDPSWSTKGVLFVFDDVTNQFGILNPSTGQFQQYLYNGSPSSFSNQDAEGMIFVTTLNDPLYGSIDGFD